MGFYCLYLKKFTCGSIQPHYPDPRKVHRGKDQQNQHRQLPDTIIKIMNGRRIKRACGVASKISGHAGDVTTYPVKCSKKDRIQNIGFTAKNHGLSQANQLFNRGSTIHFSHGEVIKYSASKFMEGIRAAVAHGVTGSMLAAAASPMLIESLSPTLMNKTALNMSVEAGWQMGNSLLYNGDLSQMDLADIGFAAFSKYGFVGMAMFDFTSTDDFRMVGYGKNVSQFGTDMFIGGYNKWHTEKMGAAGVERSVINFFNRFNGNLRNTVGTGIKKGVKDE